MARYRWTLCWTALLATPLALSACTEEDTFAVRFENDLGRPVVLALCRSDHSDRCADPHYRDRIAPGESNPENMTPGIAQEWAVEAPSGALLRCVLLEWDHAPAESVSFRLSAAPPWTRPCPDSSKRSER